ncbi:MAG: radical SAM protein [bacterium]|nr:radical SAM protein [Candidatus Sumerlaeota bacterium]
MRVVYYTPDYQVVLTRRCAYVCGYCNFTNTPSPLPASRKQFRQWLRTASRLGARQVTLTAGEGITGQPEIVSTTRYYGFEGWYDYICCLCRLVLEHNGREPLYPQIDIGSIPFADLLKMRPYSPLIKLMTHSADDSLQDKPAHAKAPHKTFRQRLAALEDAGQVGMRVATGIMIGIGENPDSWTRAAEAVSKSHHRHGNIEHFIIKPFQPMRFSAMGNLPPASDEALLSAIRAVRDHLDTRIPLVADLQDRLHLVPAAMNEGMDDLGDLRIGSTEHINFDLPSALDAVKQSTTKAGIQICERKLPVSRTPCRKSVLPGACPNGYDNGQGKLALSPASGNICL